jgi:hypothetical protein
MRKALSPPTPLLPTCADAAPRWACYGVSRARLIATLDESMVACYPQIAPENKQRMAIKNAIPAFAMCARKALLHTLNVDPDTVNACIAAAD